MSGCNPRNENVREVIVTSEDGRRMAVRVLPLRGRTHLSILDVDNPPWFFTQGTLPPTTNAWLKAVAAFPIEEPDYHWDTPRYRELCIEGGLDPDHERPEFHPADAAACEQLVQLVNQTADALPPAGLSIVMDLVELLRVDRQSDQASIAGLRHSFLALSQRDARTAERLLDLVEGIAGRGRATELLSPVGT
ncbi:hypothetical protein [Sphingomonas sp. 3-13AW]|uniref:hypothetical protein n=1 Tax=Sphingomonas sp. 3-13AW TaxID=3050450 RepID=UPI003BB5B2A3